MKRLAWLFVLGWLTAAWADPGAEGLVTQPFTGDLSQMAQRRLIRALVVYGQTDFFFIEGKPAGMQVDLLREYEKFLNRGKKKETERITIAFVPVPFDELLPALAAGKGDIAAHFLTPTEGRLEKFEFISGGGKVNEVVVRHRGAPAVASLDDLAGKHFYVLSGSSYLEHLRALDRRLRARGLAPMTIEVADPKLRSEDILELVNAGVVAYTLVDDYKADLWAQVLPDIQIERNAVVSQGSVGWTVRKENHELAASLRKFSKKVKKGTLIGNMLFKRYYKTTRWIANPGEQQERKRLGELIELFKKYGRQYGFDYLALAAQGYQESGLDQSRRSHRGAVGIMQLLPSTAASKPVGIADITTPENNIHAGAKYLAFIRDRYFSDPAIKEDERMAFTWAAYNAGPAKVRKMRKLAEKMRLDPNRWFGHVEIAAGKLVGRETVRYVSNIHKYYVAYKLVSRLYSDDAIF